MWARSVLKAERQRYEKWVMRVRMAMRMRRAMLVEGDAGGDGEGN